MEQECEPQELKKYDIEANHTNTEKAFGNFDMSGMSYIEEFIENSIPSGARRINIYIHWPSYNCKHIEICVEDDGNGINLNILRQKVFGIGQSGLKDLNSTSIHGVGGLISLYVLQAEYPNWKLETVTSESLQRGVKYIVNGPLLGNKSEGVEEELLTEHDKIGTRIYFNAPLTIFAPQYNASDLFESFINRIHERLGIKYFPLLSENEISIRVNWSHNGELKKNKGRRASSNSENNSEIFEEDMHEPMGNEVTIFPISWKKISIDTDDFPISGEIKDEENVLIHEKYISMLKTNLNEEAATNADFSNPEIFPLRHHFQNAMPPGRYYIYYRGMLVHDFPLQEMVTKKQLKAFDLSKFVCVVFLDDATDPMITNVIKNKLKRGNKAYDFLIESLRSTVNHDMRHFKEKRQKYEIEWDSEIVDMLTSSLAMFGENNITVESNTVSLEFSKLDIVITIENQNGNRPIKKIIELKRGRAESDDFIQIKDYKDQISIQEPFPEYDIEYILLARDFSKSVIERTRSFKPTFDLKLWKLEIMNEHVRSIVPFNIDEE